ncbi:MAG TPA: methyltransferase domain-containing protein, partial [Blastocatellia bacterium]
MPTWNPDQYLKFADERNRPCNDLAAQIRISNPGRIIDLGCGPGNSTAILAERWPDAVIVGLDSSASMIEAARAAYPEREWVVGNISGWAAAGPGGSEESVAEGLFDAVFSNAALQWVPDHAVLMPRLLNRVAQGGVLAIQMPANFDAPAHQAMRDIASSPRWSGSYPGGRVKEWHVHNPEFYYDVMAPHASRIDFWRTEYIHVMAGAEDIVEWYKGTGLRP